ncbi:MAG: rod shape-determining protein RodA [Candidatus Delongbacteria bacterium]|nr:rod shape-determining protein RodA [Candidatus Delongbacteria bacterium]
MTLIKACKPYLSYIFSNRNFPTPILMATISLCLIGQFFIYSATITLPDNLFMKQLVSLGIGLVIIILLQLFSYRYIFNLAPFLYVFSIIALIAVFFFGRTVSGSTRWFNLGFFNIQPSEIAKIAVTLMMAFYLNHLKPPLDHWKYLAGVFGIIMLPMALVLKQPDLGTALIFFILMIPMIFWRGFKPITIIFIVLPIINIVAAFNIWTWFIFVFLMLFLLYISKFQLRIIIFLFLLNTSIGILTPYLWNHLHDYQKQRIIVFLDPSKYKLTSGYHIIQSKVSIGSGGMFGKGLLKGTQKNLDFLPEKQTDFIFSVIGEETGFFGCMVVIGLFMIIFIYSIQIAMETRNLFGQLMVVGITSILFFQMLINIGMTIGIMPVTGIPLPFISYGGSSLLTNMILIGFILNIGRHRYEY